MGISNHVNQIATALRSKVDGEKEMTGREFIEMLEPRCRRWGLHHPRQVSYALREMKRRGLISSLEESQRRGGKTFKIVV